MQELFWTFLKKSFSQLWKTPLLIFRTLAGKKPNKPELQGFSKTEQMGLIFLMFCGIIRVLVLLMSRKEGGIMASTCTYSEIWRRYERLRMDYNSLVEAAFDDDSTLAQFAGSKRLSKMVEKIDKLLDDCSMLTSDKDRRGIQSAALSMLYFVEQALADACLFECDNVASFEDYIDPIKFVPVAVSI